MNLQTTSIFDKEYVHLPLRIQKRADKQFVLFLRNFHHPSLHIKKMGGGNIWEGRITKNYRFTFEVVGGAYVLRRVGTHDILRNP